MTKGDNSNTFVLRSRVDRKVTSYRLDPLIVQRFKERCQVQGLSSCHVLEALEYAYVMSSPDNPVIESPKFNIDLYLSREVVKRRRTKEIEEKTVWRGSVDRCCECGGVPFYVGGYKADPFTHVKKYLCVDCFRFSRANNELEYYDRVKQSKYGFEGKESRVIEKEIVKEKSSGISLRVDVKDFEDWIGIKIG